MPAIKNQVTAATNDALATENLRKIPDGGALVSLAAVGQTATDRIQLFVGQVALMNAMQPNLETDADTGPDISKDVLLLEEEIPGGDLRLEVAACGAQIGYQINIEYL